MNECYFLGSSVPEGFFSCFDQLTPPLAGWYTYVLKGGPGTGKSTLMKQVAQALEARELHCERICCASDPASLDAVIVPSLRVSLADGTAPHTLEPPYPGARGELVDLGACWDGRKLRAREAEIVARTEEYKACHARCRRFLASAQAVFDDGERLCRQALQPRQTERYAARLANRYFKPLSARVGTQRLRLLDAVTPLGIRFLSETAEALCDYRIVLEDAFGTAAGVLLGALRERALASGYDCVVSPSPGDRGSVRHLMIPALSLGFFTQEKRCPLGLQATRTVQLRRFYDAEQMRAHKARLGFAQKAAKELLEEAAGALIMAKERHDALEALYIDTMDFRAVGRIRDRIIEEIWQRDWYGEEAQTTE